jgi:hypothetical protein
MKFWKWLIEIKIKRLDAKERVVYLTNKILHELQNGGYDLKNNHTSGFDVIIYSLGDGIIQNICNNWRIGFQPEIKINQPIKGD